MADDAPGARSGSRSPPTGQLMWWRFRKHRLAVASAARPARPLRGRAVSGLLQHPGSGGDRSATGLHSGPARAALRRLVARPWVPGIVGKRNPVTLRMEWRLDEGAPGPRALLRRRPSLSPARPDPAARPPPGHRARREHQRAPARHRPARARSVVAAGARHADVDDHRPHRGHPVGRLRHRARRHLGLRRRDARSRSSSG